MLTYMFRFDARQRIFLYPWKHGGDGNNEIDRTFFLNSGSTYEHDVRPRTDITVTKHGLTVPQNAGSPESFREQMKRSEEEFTSFLREIFPAR